MAALAWLIAALASAASRFLFSASSSLAAATTFAAAAALVAALDADAAFFADATAALTAEFDDDDEGVVKARDPSATAAAAAMAAAATVFETGVDGVDGAFVATDEFDGVGGNAGVGSPDVGSASGVGGAKLRKTGSESTGSDGSGSGGAGDDGAGETNEAAPGRFDNVVGEAGLSSLRCFEGTNSATLQSNFRFLPLTESSSTVMHVSVVGVAGSNLPEQFRREDAVNGTSDGVTFS